MPKDYNWEKVTLDYITGRESIKKIAERFKIPLSTVQSRATREGWSEQRKAFRAKARDKTSEKIASELARKLKKEFNAANKLSKVITDALKDADQFYRYINSWDGEMSETVLSALNTARLAQAVKALKDIAELKKIAGDLVTEVEARRLALAEKGNVTDDDEGGVVILPESEINEE